MTISRLIEEKSSLERLEMRDQESKGCSVTLGEWLSTENIDIIWRWHLGKSSLPIKEEKK